LRLRPHRAAVFLLVAVFSAAQDSSRRNSGNERTFPQPVAAVQAALKKLPGGASGRLPVLDGFVVPGPHSLSSYQRPYYQCEVRVTPAKSGGSLVRVTTKITAWLSSPAHSGYETLESNGRVESDLLDRLQNALASTSSISSMPGTPAEESHDNPSAAKSAAPEINAPVPRLPDHPGLSIRADSSNNNNTNKDQINPQNKDLQREAKSLEEILRNQSHPTNLVAVKKQGTPILQSPVIDAKVLFLASAEDEFEVLEENPDWVHVRISGLSRGWLRRSMVEMLSDSQPRADGEPSAAPPDKPAPADAQSAAPFAVGSEEVGSFPGDWSPLKGKNVKIISLQQAPGTGRITSPQEKKQFAEALFKKESRSLAADAAGLVLVFDAEDGGMVASTRAALQQWNSGALSEAAFWKQCFLDPPEILGAN
jgi:hypothetical protein